jgi:ABC-type Mn2+/Zn2+ transport system permease subunit
MYFFFAIVGLVCAICAIISLESQPNDGVQVIGLLSLAVFGMAMTMIFVYAGYREYKENKAYDLAAKEQLMMDYEYADYDM